MEKLFDIVTKIVASPHTAILDHDRLRAAQIFLAFDDYLIDIIPGYTDPDREINFGAYAAQIIDKLENKNK
jgi:hypothetical protein